MLDYSAAITPSLTGTMALFTLIGYVVVYSMVFSAGLYYLMRVLFEGLEADYEQPESLTERPKRPLSAAHTQFEIGKITGRPVTQGEH
jgi:cytochrome d ubiquinol oxidase subunit I